MPGRESKSGNPRRQPSGGGREGGAGVGSVYLPVDGVEAEDVKWSKTGEETYDGLYVSSVLPTK